MEVVFTCLMVAVGLSMDAFSLALIYGTYGLSKSNELLLSIIVGLFHFFMPLLGAVIGGVLIRYFVFNLELVVGLIFFIIGIEMIVSSKKEEEVKILIGIIGYLIFGLSVSIDSFTTGIGMSVVSNNHIGVSLMFMIISGIFTYVGLVFGNKLSYCFGKYATFCGGLLLCVLGIYRLFK